MLFGVVGFPQASRVFRVILRGCGLDLAPGLLFFASGVVTEDRGIEEASFPRPVLAVGVEAELGGWETGDEFLPAEAFLPFFSTLFGVKTSNMGGSLRGVPSSPGEKDRKEQ